MGCGQLYQCELVAVGLKLKEQPALLGDAVSRMTE